MTTSRTVVPGGSLEAPDGDSLVASEAKMQHDDAAAAVGNSSNSNGNSNNAVALGNDNYDSILKSESRYAPGASRKRHKSGRKLTFADDHGGELTQDTYVEALHYSAANINYVPPPKGCCTIM